MSSNFLAQWFSAVLLVTTPGVSGEQVAAVAPPAEPPRAAAALQEQALTLIPRDDTESLEQAIGLLDEAARLDPRLFQARADRVFVQFLLAAARRDEGARLISGEQQLQLGRELRERALDELRPLVREHPNAYSVVRALAIYHAFEGDSERTAKYVQQARRERETDPWIDLAELVSGLRDVKPQVAVERLAAFSALHPEMLRVRVMMAGAQIDQFHLDDAVSILDEILASHPGHDPALRLKERALTPPAVRVSVVPIPATAPPPRASGFLPRKRSSEAKPARERPASSERPNGLNGLTQSNSNSDPE